MANWLKYFLLKDTNDETIEDVLKKYQPAKTILSSVIDHNAGIEKILAERFFISQTECRKVFYHLRRRSISRKPLAQTGWHWQQQQFIFIREKITCYWPWLMYHLQFYQ